MSASAITELRAAFEDPFSALGRDPARDQRTIVMSWPSVPVELVHTAGLLPVFARGGCAATPAADRVLEPDLFPNNTGIYDIKDAEYLKCTVSTGKPMEVGEEYKVAIQFWDKYGTGTIDNKLTISIVDAP